MTVSTLSRRGLLATGLSLAAYGATPAWAVSAPFFKRHNLEVGLQIYALGANVLDDIPGTLRQAKQAGYHAVEIQGEFADRDPPLLKKQLAEAGVVARSTQSSFDPGLDLAKLAAGVRLIGADQCVTYTVQSEVLGVPWGTRLSPEQRLRAAHATVDGWKRAADFLNEKGRVLKQHGVALCYHNHNWEWGPVGDATGLDLLIQNTDPNWVHFQQDIGWTATAGGDPIALFKQYKGRFRSAHIKDIKSSTPNNFTGRMDNAIVGQGNLDWPKILAAAYDAGVRRFFVEHEDPNRNFAAVAASKTFLDQVIA